ncbi:hypothetical protein [Mycolicibacterium stellerae]|uniref:hypothetical protein n=1 Tax=Mycolicibacterium stellerae TaxID=2358193 RepID=UPI001F1B46F4|nr:hypothetical protein [Mycolicibacterium stellerae]
MSKVEVVEVDLDAADEPADGADSVEASAPTDAPKPVRRARTLRLRRRTHSSLEEDGLAHDGRPPRRWAATLGFYVVPAIVLLMALGVGYLKYTVDRAKADERAAAESVQAAKDGAVAMLSYTPDTAEKSLSAARDRLTGGFRDEYTSLTRDVVIPGAKQRMISATATVAEAASASATANHAVVLLFINQAVTTGQDAPTSTASVVEVALDHRDSRWLISGFNPK